MTRWLTHLTALLVLVGACALPGNSAAQAAEPPTGDNSDSEAEPEPAEGSQPSSEVFIPTEEISEDFAVSFPVDI